MKRAAAQGLQATKHTTTHKPIVQIASPESALASALVRWQWQHTHTVKWRGQRKAASALDTTTCTRPLVHTPIVNRGQSHLLQRGEQLVQPAGHQLLQPRAHSVATPFGRIRKRQRHGLLLL